MADFFPRHTVEWKLRERPFIRRLSLSLPMMAIVTGIIARAYRWLVLSYGAMSWWLLLASISGGLILLLGLATAYLGNHPVRQWVWRAPLFVLVESATEAAASAILLAAGLERFGTDAAHWRDWPTMAFDALLWRTIVILSFALVLAAVVQWVRFALLKREHRSSTAVLIHERNEEDAAAKPPH